MSVPKLFMLLLGCKPEGRHTEQHDIFFSVGNTLNDLKTDILDFWPEANGKLHIDAWREVTVVNGYALRVVDTNAVDSIPSDNKLFFLNLGGYKAGEFEELHYKMLVIAANLGAATKRAKDTDFYKNEGFDGAVSHIDDKYGVDVDEAFEVTDVLPSYVKRRFSLQIQAAPNAVEDKMHLGYLPLSKL